VSRYQSLLLVAVLLALLVPAASAAIAWGPYVTNTTTGSATVTWKATGEGAGWVEYSPGGDEVYRVASSGEGGMHRVQLTGLLPVTTYHYRVSTGDETTGDAAAEGVDKEEPREDEEEEEEAFDRVGGRGHVVVVLAVVVDWGRGHGAAGRRVLRLLVIGLPRRRFPLTAGFGEFQFIFKPARANKDVRIVG